MRTVLFAALLAATVPTLASAQGGSFETTLGGGVTIPMGNTADLYETGFHGAASIGYRALDSKVAFKLHASLHRLNQDAFTDAHANVFAAFVRADLDVSPMAYVIGGVGIVRNENQAVVSGVRFTNTNSDPAMTAGMGIRFGKNLFAEGRLMYGFGDPKSTLIPITVGLRF
ncbi:MAG: outer membrane beta-barrel protein [Gemmatimonadetes bacterium]|nr:outer membrane beta-barrel protein [Gemmatimonadota bacterium]MBL0178424.1 outer membrane beta-barrel protein [Gemmatimonadota bacterium]